MYENLGFKLTPRTYHEDRMGTSNRLAQFASKNFIELLEVDRPEKLTPHDFKQTPPFFSFGEQNRSFVSQQEGMAMLVFATNDARADIDIFKDNKVETYAPFDFDRLAKLPAGQEVTVSFTLAFATSPDMPRIAFFVCQNRAQVHFWKADYQVHENQAEGIKTVYLATTHAERDAAFLEKMFGGEVTPISGGFRVACGLGQEIKVLEPQVISEMSSKFNEGKFKQYSNLYLNSLIIS